MFSGTFKHLFIALSPISLAISANLWYNAAQVREMILC